MTRIVTLLTILVVVPIFDASAQQVTVEGNVDHPAVTRLREVVAAGNYRVIDRDTVFPATVVIPGDLVIASADVRLEGSVSGSVVVLPGGAFFLRPGGRVGGAVVGIDGGVFLSDNATTGEVVELPASVASELERSGAGLTIRLTPPARPPVVSPAGFFGVGIPTYDRVNGISVSAGLLFRPLPDTSAPALELSASYHQARSDFGGRAAIRYAPRQRLLFLVEAARQTATNDRWIRGDLANSAAAILLKSDVRNYYEEDLAAIEVRRLAPTSLEVGESFLVPRLRIEGSRARSLASQEPWAILGDEWRENPAIDEGDIVSATAGAAVGWRGLTSSFAGDGSVEWAPGGIGDFDFAQVEAAATWNMLALWNHTASIRARGVLPVGTTPPAQRWYLLGGPGTIPTLETGEHRGDHLLFVETSYLIPVPLTLPVLGPPSFLLHHAIGAAWTAEQGRPPFDQNVGVGVVFSLARATLDVDPSDTSETALGFSVSLPIQ